MNRSFIALSACLVIAACAQAPQAQKALSTDIAGLGKQTNVVTTRELAGPTTYLGPMPTAVLVLVSGNDARNQQICNAFMTLPTTAQVQAGGVTPNIIPVRWPMTTDQVTASADCTTLLRNYDYSRASQILQSVKNLTDSNGAATTLGTQGPYIVEIIPTPSGTVGLIADASLASQPAQFNQFVTAATDALLQTASAITTSPPNSPQNPTSTAKTTAAGASNSWWQIALTDLWKTLSDVFGSSPIIKVALGAIETACEILVPPKAS